MKNICVFICLFIYNPALSKILWLCPKCNNDGGSREGDSPLGLAFPFPLLPSPEKPQLHPYLNHNSTAHNAQKFTFPLKYICMLLHTIA